MAKPQVEDGFVMIALDLFVALMSLDLPNREAVVLAEVLSQCYGPSKRRNVPLDLVNMEDHTGIHRNNIRRAIAGLVDANILTRNDDGTYRFLKDWENYRPGGEPFVDRLGGKLAVFARGVKARFGRIKPSVKDPIQLDSGPTVVVNPTGLGFSRKPQSGGIGPTADISGNGCDVNHSMPTINENLLAPARAHAPENNSDFKRIQDSLSERESEMSSPIPNDAEPFHAEPVPIPKAEPKPIGVNSVADCERTFQVANKLFEMTSMPTLCQQWLADHPARKVIAAMDDAVGKSKPTRYVQTLLDDPEYGKPRPSNGQPVVTRALPPQNVNPPAPKGPPVDPAETEAAIASLRSSRPEFRRKTGGPK